MDSPEKGVDVAVGAFFQQGVGASCASVMIPGELPRTHGWEFGIDQASPAPPVFAMEPGLLHSLLLVEQHNSQAEVPSPPFYQVRTGTWELMSKLIRWFNEGDNGLLSTAASDIIMAMGRLEGELRCPLIVRSLPKGFFESTNPR